MEAPRPASDCALSLFLNGLLDDGRVAVSREPLPHEFTGHPLLQQLDERARADLALEAPAFSAEAALWSARLVYGIAQLIVCRDLSAEQIDQVFAKPCPTPPCPETTWSVDLTLRHLPRLFNMAKHLSSGDPLVDRLKALAEQWPLTSVGMPFAGAVNLGHPALDRLYADRVFAAADLTRLADPQVADRLRADIGLHRELAPTISAKLFVTHEGN